jgi:hypothetical protein
VPALIAIVVVLVVGWIVLALSAALLPLLLIVVAPVLLLACLVAAAPTVTKLRRETNKRYRSTAWPTWNSRLDVAAQHMLITAVLSIYALATAVVWLPQMREPLGPGLILWGPAFAGLIWNFRVGIRRWRAAPPVALRALAEWLPGGRSELPSAPAPVQGPADSAPSWAAPVRGTLDDTPPTVTQ